MASERTLLQEAEDPRTLPGRLHEIVGISHGDQVRSRGAEVRETVAANPNASPALLGDLVLRFPKAVLRNPALPFVLLEDPGWADKLHPVVALRMLHAEDVPAALLSALTARPDSVGQDVRPGLIGQDARLHVGLAGECGEDWEAEAREALWQTLGLTSSQKRPWQAYDQPFPARLIALDLAAPWMLVPLAAHGDAAVRRAIARSLRAPRDLLTLLRRAGSTSDLGGLAPPDPALPAPDLAWLARGGPWAKRLAARHPNTPPAALEALGRENDETLSRHLVGNPSAPAALREWLAVSLGPVFRRSSARDPETPPEALARLAADEVRDVRWMAARNPHTPPEALTALARDADARVRQGLGRNAAAPAPLLALLAGDPVRWVRLAAARHPNTPPAALAELAEDTDEEVQQSVARRDAPRRPRPPAPERGSTPPPVRVRPRPSVVDAQEAARALEEWSKKLGTKTWTGEGLTWAGLTGEWPTWASLLTNPDMSVSLLAKGATAEFWPYRLAVARNPSVLLLALERPEAGDALARLARDGNRLVRAAARAAIEQKEARP